jgi:tetratricopeptide (TPR) repeat protein
VSSIVEHKAFKWIVIASSLFVVFAVTGGFLFKQYLHQREIGQEIAQRKEDDWNYREKFRSAMYRIRQNLKLEHFLAAYKNLDSVPPPKRSDPLMVEEYADVLYRIGKGLFANNLLKESESVFQMVHEFQDRVPQANEALSEIESKRNLESARLHYSQGAKLFEQTRYRDAAAELQKADVELNSVQNLKFDDVTEDKVKVAAIYREARFHINLEDTEQPLKEAEQMLKFKDFKKAQSALAKAAKSIGKAAFIHPEAPQIKSLRGRLFDLDAEMGFLIPNSVPIRNNFPRELVGKTPRYFFLNDYEFTSVPDSNHFLTIGLKFERDQKEPYFIVRYRIFFYNGEDIFNGHFLTPGDTKPDAEGVESVIYKQELPEGLWASGVKQIEVKIFDSNDVLISQVSRAFRRGNS